MKYFGILVFLVSSQIVSADFTIEDYYNGVCGPRTFAASSSEDEVDVITGTNLVTFIKNPAGYTTGYRQELYDYYISLNGKEQIFKHAATQVLGAAYEQADVDENKGKIKEHIDELLRQYVRDYIVPIQWNFCAAAVELKPLISEYGCNGLAGIDFDYQAVDQFCQDPYVY